MAKNTDMNTLARSNFGIIDVDDKEGIYGHKDLWQERKDISG